MIKFKQLYENWTTSFDRNRYKVNIFVNPSHKELGELRSKGTAIRGIIATNGKVYLADNGIHAWLYSELSKRVLGSNSIPIVINTNTNKIQFGNYIKNLMWNYDLEGAKEKVRNNLWIKRNLPNFTFHKRLVSW